MENQQSTSSENPSLNKPEDSITCSNETSATSLSYQQHGMEGNAENADPCKNNENLIHEYGDRMTDHITLIDPVGVKWILPFQECRTWKTAKELLKGIFSKSLPWWIYDHMRFSEDEEQGYSIVRLGPEESCFALDHWEKMVQPGCLLRIQIQGKQKYVREALTRPHDDETSDKDSSPESEQELDADVGYIAHFYQQDGGGYPDWLREKSYSAPIIKQVQGQQRTSKCVLEEIRNVFLNLRKRGISDEDEYDRIESDDIISNPFLRICSSELLDALKSIIQFQSVDQDEDEENFNIRSRFSPGLRNGIFRFPYMDLYHYKDELLAYKSSTSGPRQRHSLEYNQECDRQIDILVNYLYDQPVAQLREAEEAWSRANPVTTFFWIWLLLKPGANVYVREGQGVNGYVIESVARQPSVPNDSSSIWTRPYTIKLWNLESDWRALSRSIKIIDIPVFDGEREITSLPVYPVRFHGNKPGQEHVWDALIERGKKYVKAVKHPTLQEYTGYSHLHSGRTFNGSRVVVDHLSKPWNDMRAQFPNVHIPLSNEEYEIKLGLNTRIPGCPCAECKNVDSGVLYRRLAFEDYDNLDASEHLTYHQYFLCWSHVYGYALQDRIWDLMDVRGLRDPRIEKNIIDTLVMKPESNKSMIKAICETYTQKQDRENLFFADFVRGKGEGQIILLHGPPGTGKTLTAVFLRALDYFQGIMFLTTNRVGSFDEAFMSRIHVQLGYEPLDDAARQQIWKNSFDKLSANHKIAGCKINYSYQAKQFVSASTQLKDLQWNGREIRNAFQTAVTLASFEAKQRGEETPEVTENHLSQVVEMSCNFKKYMKSALQSNDADLAFRARLRNDKFQLVPLGS